MAKTVAELRNEIRKAVGRYERIESTGFTKEALAAICTSLGAEIETHKLPPKSEMRATILERIDAEDKVDPATLERSFRKAELQSINAALQDE
ncbi:hypothetical protein [Natronolimnobius baerhuensis]|uniref:Uncharacterized protein n=1 Tax=Natronolimnobius baerhuensis TaxID=253108 RepID=A0A202EA98_9EURY|nr:hypothetical protein [Natronolimnobius baerhuensis]OVE85172.1 hypothetical protein B2G88_06610 [Natronolimnobius baerhuensis]